MIIIKDRVNRILRLEQIIYIKKFLIDYNIIELMITLTLIINNKFYIIENNFIIIKKSHHAYQFIINFLIYIILSTRPNIAFAILIIFQYDSNLNISY